jgi:hypothetical protein
MSPTPPTEPDLEMLREMTGAPDLNKPLLKEETFEEKPVRSARPVWKLPVPKLLLIGAALLPVFALAGLFMAGGRQARLADEGPRTPDAEETETGVSSTEAELQQAREEIAALKAQMALEDQGHLQTATEAKPESRSTTPTVSATPPKPAATPATVTSPQRVSATPAPPVVRQPTPVRRVQPAPAPIAPIPRPTSVAAAPTPEPAVDPVERWRELAQLGSYGSGAMPENVVEPETQAASVAQAQWVESTGARPSIPAPATATAHQISAPETLTTEPAPIFSSMKPDTPESTLEAAPAPVPVESASPESMPSLEVAAEAETVAAPEILTAAEARILQATSTPPALIAGTQSAGELATPVVLDEPAGDDNFVVVLTEPLLDSQGQVAIPAGGELVVRVDDVADNGLVQLSAIQALWQDQGYQRELTLPNGYIQIRGHQGTPLTADQYNDLGPEIAAMDAGQFALGAIRRASELYTRPNTRVETNSGSTVITEENPAPNVLAGVLEGGTDAILDTIADRNQQAIAELEQRPRIAYIEAGRPVQVFVNQTLQMPNI